MVLKLRLLLVMVQKQKHIRFGYDIANACGKTGITIQGASALFLANMKRIIKLKEEKMQNNG